MFQLKVGWIPTNRKGKQQENLIGAVLVVSKLIFRQIDDKPREEPDKKKS